MAIKYYNNFDGTTTFSDVTFYLTLKAGVVTTVTVPGNSDQNLQALFGYANSSSNVFVGYNSTPAVPADNTATSTGRVEARPDKRYTVGGDILSFLTPDTTAYVGVSFRSLPSGK